jgi:NAD(P)-dependent dehydrogenase (short-subunit alcohol dehydrogenase family)
VLFDLHHRVALVTGAGQNVGSGIARMLAAQGAAVAVNDLARDRADATIAAITSAGGRAVAAPFDVTDRAAAVDGIGAVAAELGPVDILVNNAGNWGAHTMVPGPFREMDPETAWDAPLRVNLYGVLNCCHAVISGMCEREWGRVITVASGAGTTGLGIGVSTYGAAKGAAIAFMRHLAIENARFGVTANTLAIGLMAHSARSDVTAGLARSVPVGRLGTPDDIAAVCVYLASDEASWMTGQTIQLNGGSVTT